MIIIMIIRLLMNRICSADNLTFNYAQVYEIAKQKKRWIATIWAQQARKTTVVKMRKEMTQRDAMPAECNLFIDEHVFRFYRPAAYRLIPDMVILYFI